MAAPEESLRVLREAEASLRQLIERCLREQRYRDVAEVARLAEGVARLIGQPADESVPKSLQKRRSIGPSPSPKENAMLLSTQASEAKPKKGNEYPRFERDGDRLVKVGWSKKNQEAYEHRAPQEAVIGFVRHLESRVKPGEVFVMDELFPIPDIATGDEVPAYQAYLTLAWLRLTGAVEKKGRDGYVLRMDSLSDGGLDQLWNRLPERKV